jgi:uncharacterized protein (DUF362 family)/Pyruvate/2-oxoacid:ferredoxin oxidoreductase delta subunit
MPTVSIKECSEYDKNKIKKLVLESLKEIKFDLKKYRNKKILLKPNLLGPFEPKEAITTHPIFMQAVAEIFKKVTNKITIADSSDQAYGRDDKVLETTGMNQVAKKLKIKTEMFKAKNIIFLKSEKNQILKQVAIQSEIKNFDLIVNMPKLKTHMLTGLTGAIKNIFGLVPSYYKREYHIKGNTPKKFSSILVDIYNVIQPKLNIIDGIVALEGDGPSRAGKPIKINVILTSDNAIASDLIAAKILGFENVLTNQFALERNLIDKKDIKVIGEIKLKNFEKPSHIKQVVAPFVAGLFQKLVTKRPYVNKNCKKCLTCLKACPAKAISLKNNNIFINKNKCILCYCCSELCPYNAIELKRSWLGKKLINMHDKMFKKVKNGRRK